MAGDRRTRTGASKPPTDALIGRTLDGRYLVQTQIARGGMATVYVAQDNRLQRTVALKVMHPGLGSDETFAARFVREARSAAQLDHPNVVAVFDQGEDHGTLYLAMELVRGKTLRDMMTGPMPAEKALAYLEPVLAALAAAHRAGIVHRDVKPENVLISPASPGTPGRIKVADFGLARAVTAQTQHTSTGTIIGTVSYLAPELVERGSADARVDVYAAGVLLYEMLTGSKPHTGETPIQVAYKHVHEDIPAPSQTVKGIPSYVDALVARATARNPAQRFSDAGEFLKQLHRVARTLATGATEDPELTAALNLGARLPEPTAVLTTQGDPTVAVERTQQRSVREDPAAARKKKRRGLIALVLGLLLLGIGIGVGWWFLIGRYHPLENVEGLDYAAAVQKLTSEGYHVVDGETRWSADDKAGEVAGTEPSAGARVLDGATITLFKSKGKERYALPDLTKQPLGQAQAWLTAHHFKIAPIQQDWSDTVANGSVISMNPKAATTAFSGDTISLVVSKGQEPITLADYSGQKVTEAKAALAALKLKIDGSTKEYSTTVAAGVIIRQTPAPGQIVHHGDTITVVVSKGPPLVAVPSVAGMSWADAERTLNAANLKATPGNKQAEYARDFPTGAALFGATANRTNPGTGEMVKPGSTVKVYF